MKQTTIKSLLLALILGSISQGTLQAMENNQINAQEEQDLQQAIELSLAEYETQQVIRNNNNHSWLSINLTHEQAINEFALYVPKLENHYLLVKVENITQADKIAIAKEMGISEYQAINITQVDLNATRQSQISQGERLLQAERKGANRPKTKEQLKKLITQLKNMQK